MGTPERHRELPRLETLIAGKGTELEHPVAVIQSYPIWLPQTQTWLYNQVRYLPMELIEAHIVCERTQNLDQFALPNIHCARHASELTYMWDRGLRGFHLPNHLGSVARTARRFAARVVHSHFGEIGYANLGAAARAGVRHVVTFYGDDLSLPRRDPRWRPRYIRLFRQADRFLCEGGNMARTLEALGCPQSKIKVQHLGVDLEAIPFRPRQWTPAEPLRVLIAARFQEKKGLPYALEALGAIRTDVELQITVIGDADKSEASIEAKERILGVIDRCSLGPVVRMMGYQTHSVLAAEAARHHIFISPSVTAGDGDTEGGAPVTITEMVASGIPVVSTAHADIPEVVHYGRPDWLAPERDVAELVLRLKTLISDPSGWRPMLELGRQHVEREYSGTEQGRRLAEIYAELAGCSQASLLQAGRLGSDPVP